VAFLSKTAGTLWKSLCAVKIRCFKWHLDEIIKERNSLPLTFGEWGRDKKKIEKEHVQSRI